VPPVVVPPPPTVAPAPPVAPPVVPTTVPTNSSHAKGTVVFNEAHNTTHRYSYAAPEAIHYTPLPSTTTRVNMGFVHHMEQLSAAGAVKTI
jgi:hypothetical protein